MFTTHLTKKLGTYRALHLVNFLAILIAPFFNTHLYGIGEGGGTVAEQEKKELLDKINNNIKTAADNAKKELQSIVDEIKKTAITDGQFKEFQETIDKRLEPVNAFIKELSEKGFEKEVKELKAEFNEILKKQGMEIAAMKENSGRHTVKDNEQIGKKLLSALESDQEIKDTLKFNVFEEKTDPDSGEKVKGFSKQALAHLKNGGKISIKAAIDMTTALTARPGSDPGTSIGSITDYSMKPVDLVLVNDVPVFSMFPTTPTAKSYFGVIIYDTYFDGADTTAEGTAAPQSSFKVSTKEFKVFDIPTFFDIHENVLEDFDGLMAQLNRKAPDAILSKVAEKILGTTGDGSTDIKGIRVSGNYTAFDATTWAGKVTDASIIDAISKAKLQAILAEEDVTHIALHPSDIEAIEDVKNALGDSVTLRKAIFDNTGKLVRVCGLIPMRNKKMTSNQFVMYNYNNSAEIGVRKDIEMQIGYDGNGFKKRIVTIRFVVRVAFGVAKASSIIYSSDITADVAELKYSGA